MPLAPSRTMNSPDARLVVEHVNRKFTATDARLDRLDIRLARLEVRLDALIARLAAMAERGPSLVDVGDMPMIE